ncbi:MAG: prepilin-type N-terminal cleavage/methylation domain-containing protein [Elusimicrobiaceae bacterium]|nr:prepilin-type N-terminal cleavage/methylation domain-containing protein [Elusimicrobiaceae bacterium]
MKNLIQRKSGGFTLIELLVVVLIIGILSSVALPQYTKAVKKARAAEVWTVGKAFLNAQDIYFLANDTYTDDLEALDITIPESKNFEVRKIMADDEAFFIEIDGKAGLSGFAFRWDVEWQQDGRAAYCYGDQKQCINMLPCIGIGSGDSAHCSL